MAYKNIPYLLEGKQAIDKEYRNLFLTDNLFHYESGDLEKFFQNKQYDLPNGNAKRWDYLIIKLNNQTLQRVVFAEPHPIKPGNVTEVLKKLEWLQETIKVNSNLKHFENTNNEYYWIFKNSAIRNGTKEWKQCKNRGLIIQGHKLII